MVHEKIGPYRIVRLLGSGGMGHVYEALQEPIERRVALKVLRPEFASDAEILDRFFNEARVVNRIEHPSLVQVTDFGRTDSGVTYIAMEFLRGETLEQRLRGVSSQGNRMPIAQVLDLAWQVAEAVAAAHEKGIIHRDLKPDNLMLCPDPMAPSGERVRILDFGIAKLLEPGNGGQTKTQALMGTPRYMSPEQCRGAGQVDARTDVYSLGVIVYQLLAGVPPFVAEGVGEIIAMQLLSEPPPLSPLAPHASVELCELVHSLLRKDRAARPTMAEARDALVRLRASFALRSVPGTLAKGQAVVSANVDVAPVPVDELPVSEAPHVPNRPQTAIPSLASEQPLDAFTEVDRTTLGSSAGEPALRRRRVALLSFGGAALAVALLMGLRFWRGTSPSAQQPEDPGALVQPSAASPGLLQAAEETAPTRPDSPGPMGAPSVHAEPREGAAPSATSAPSLEATQEASLAPTGIPVPSSVPAPPMPERPNGEAATAGGQPILKKRVQGDTSRTIPTEQKPAQRPLRRSLQAKRSSPVAPPPSAPRKVDYVD